MPTEVEALRACLERILASADEALALDATSQDQHAMYLSWIREYAERGLAGKMPTPVWSK